LLDSSLMEERKCPICIHYRASIIFCFSPNLFHLSNRFLRLFDYSHFENRLWVELENYVGIQTSLVFIGFLFYTHLYFPKRESCKKLSFQENGWCFCCQLSYTYVLICVSFRFDLGSFLCHLFWKQVCKFGSICWGLLFCNNYCFFNHPLNAIISAKWRNVLLTLVGCCC